MTADRSEAEGPFGSWKAKWTWRRCTRSVLFYSLEFHAISNR